MKNKHYPLGKIVLGMSGGVDSSVCAYLLKKQGYEIIGLFMQNWDTYLNNDIAGHVKSDDKQCNAQKDFSVAQKVAKKLNIKIYRTEFINKY
jgi:tRNA-specific 2-thiouridylase